MGKKKKEAALVRKQHGVLVDVAGYARTEAEAVGLTPWQVAKWLTYTLLREDAKAYVLESIADTEATLKQVRAAKGPRVPRYKGDKEGSPKGEYIKSLEEDLAEYRKYSMVDARNEQQDCAMDDRDAYFDEDAFDVGEKYDRYFDIPLVDRKLGEEWT